MFSCQIPSRLYALASAVMPSQTTQERTQQQRKLINEKSAFSKLKHWFNKGIQKDHTATPNMRPNHQRQMEATYVSPAPQAYIQPPNRPDLVPPCGPRALPRAVHVEARTARVEVENESFPFSSNTTQATSLTSLQSSRPSDRPRAKPIKKRKSGNLRISGPQPTKSLLDLTSHYADVQNPQKAYDASSRRSLTAAPTKPPLFNKDNRGGGGGGRDKRYQPDQPIKEVAKGRAQIVQPPVHQRSQKTVVRKMPPQVVKRADNGRHMSNVTIFDEFMGKDTPPPVPALPANLSNLVPPGPTITHRLSRPFFGAPEFAEEAGKDDSDEDISPTTIPISPSSSHAQTWLKYDQSADSVSRTARSSGVFPRFPPRNLTRPDSSQQTSRFNACQSCRERIHPSRAVSHNGTYFCQSCAASPAAAHTDSIAGKEEPPHFREVRYPYAAGTYGKDAITDNKVTRKPLPKPSPIPRGPLMPSNNTHNPTHNISGSTLLGSSTPPLPSPTAPKLQRSPRVRRKDIPPEYEHLYSPDVQNPSFQKSAVHATTTKKEEERKLDPYYNTPRADGTYPRYRTPPPPPITIPSASPFLPLNQQGLNATHNNPTTTATGLRKPAPPSSIYPTDQTPRNMGRLSRVPSLPQHPAAYDIDVPSVPRIPTRYEESYGRLEGAKVKRSDTVASDSSYRAAREEEVIDAYADLYAGGGGSPVSPISEWEGGGRREWGRAESVISEYRAPRMGWVR
ncbi:MAG: hypothetical protein Q9208_006017 [Pyrenodesmia sp. 3 TL-2023]